MPIAAWRGRPGGPDPLGIGGETYSAARLVAGWGTIGSVPRQPTPVADDVRAWSAPAEPARTGDRRIGVLLSHGFTGSPASIRPWAEALAARGYGVEVPRLPGHGTDWRGLNRTRWDDWYAEITRVHARLAADHDRVVLAGLSMGGALVLRLAADVGDAAAGLVLVNPAVHTQRKDVLALPVLKHLVPSFPGIGDDIKKPGVSERGYDRTPLRAAHSMMQAWPPLRAALPAITAPVLLYRSAVDHVVDPSSAAIIRDTIGSTDVTEVVLEDSYHVATLDHDAARIFDGSAAFIGRVCA